MTESTCSYSGCKHSSSDYTKRMWTVTPDVVKERKICKYHHFLMKFMMKFSGGLMVGSLIISLIMINRIFPSTFGIFEFLASAAIVIVSLSIAFIFCIAVCFSLDCIIRYSQWEKKNIGLMKRLVEDDLTLNDERKCEKCNTTTGKGVGRKYTYGLGIIGSIVIKFNEGIHYYCDDCVYLNSRARPLSSRSEQNVVK